MMSGTTSFPVRLIARIASRPQQGVWRGHVSSGLPAKLSSPLSCTATSNCAELRRFYHGAKSVRSVGQLRKTSPSKSSFFTQNLHSSGESTLQLREFSSGRPVEMQKKDKKESTMVNAATQMKAKLLDKIPLPRENIYTIPNILTFSRLAVAPFIGYFIVNQNHVLALSLFAYASATDLVDGWIARKFNQQTVVGTIVDPMADKTLMTVGVVCLAMNGSIPIWLAGLILARDVGLAISAIYYRWISLPPPKTMARYWDFSLPSAEVKPTTISKANTALQLLLVGSAMTIPVLPEAMVSAWSVHEGLIGLQYLVATTTTWSGLSYIYSKDAVKILTKEEIEARSAEKKTLQKENELKE